MVARGKTLPERIKPDAVIEAVLEIRFESSTVLPELLFAAFAEHKPWLEFQKRQLPASQMPSQLRAADPNLRYAPIYELAGSEAGRVIRLGPNVMSYHVAGPYPGWDRFRDELHDATTLLFAKAPGTTIQRLGLRYVNALTVDKHGITSPNDMDLRISISDEEQKDNFNLNLVRDLGNETACLVKIATPAFLQGSVPEKSSVILDIDVYTVEQFAARKLAKSDDVVAWMNGAHDCAREEFFHLLKDETVAKLKVARNA